MVCAAFSPEDAVGHCEGDEVWECDSEVESCSNASHSDEESDGDMPLPLPPSPVAAQIQTILQQKRMAPPVPVPKKMPPPPALQVRTVKTAPAQGPSPWSKGAMELALHLRKDNERLREALVDAQRQAEEAVEQGESNSAKDSNVDFAHLLELVKEFGTGLEDIGETEHPDGAVETCMSFNTEEFRMDEDDVDDKDMEIKRLESELAELKDKLEMQQLGAKCAMIQDEEDEDAHGPSELVGYWVSSKSGGLHRVGEAEDDVEADVASCTEWQVVEADKESVTLMCNKGVEHTVERLKTRMFGDALLWGSGDLWTRQSKA